MRKLIYITLALLLGLSFAATGAWAYTFPNNTYVKAYSGAEDLGNFWQDCIGDPAIYEVFGGDLTQNSGNYYLTIYTNWNPIHNGDSPLNVQTADLFLDTNMDGNWDAAVVLDTDRTDFRTVYYSPAITTSYDLYSSASTSYGGLYDESDPKYVPVLGTNSDPLKQGLTSVLWTSGSPNTVEILLTGITGFDPTHFAYLMASATCANDTGEGKVPLPSTLLLLGSGILGLAGLGWRRSRKEG